MKITGLHIDTFGIWSDLSIDGFPPGTLVFFGPNEAGKSTLLQFLRTMLYGFTDERSRRFVEKFDGEKGVLNVTGRVGGSLSLVSREQEYCVLRHGSPTDPTSAIGEVRVTSRDGSRHGANRLATLLADIDETVFNNVFAIGLHEMQHLGTLNDTQAARFLYSLSAGTDRVSLVDVMRQLQATRHRLVGGSSDEAYLRQLLDRQVACRERMKKLSVQGDLWAQLRSELHRLDDEVARLESSREKIRRRTEQAELALRVQPSWERQHDLKIELDALGQVPKVPADVSQRLGAVDQELAATRGRSEQQSQHVVQLQRDLQAHGGATAVTRLLARIEALLDQQSTITGLHDDVQRLKEEVDESELELHAEQERLGISSDEQTIVPRFDSATFASLREPARQMEHLRGLLEQAKKDGAAAKEEAGTVEQYLAETLGKDPDWFEGKDERDIVQALEQTGEVAAALRQRSQLKSRVVDCRKKLETLSARRKRLLTHQLLPWEVVKALGAMFAVGSMLLIWAFLGNRFGLVEPMRTGLGILGGIGVATATLLKLVLQNASQDDLDLCNRDTEAMERQLEEAEEEFQKLERKLPAGRSGPVKLHDAETRIVRLESLLPIEGQRRRMLDRAAAAERHAVEYATQMKEARHRWESQLERLGLSRKLTPVQVRELAGDSGKLVHLHRRHEETVEQLERADRELEAYRGRMRDVMADAGLSGKAGTALDELNHLQLYIHQHHEHRSQRDTLQERIRRAQRDQQQTSARLHDLQRRRDNILSSVGAIDDEDLNNMQQQRERLETLRQQLKNVAREVRHLLGDDAEVLATMLGRNDRPAIQKTATTGRQELERVDLRLKELLQRRGQVEQRLRDLDADRQLDLARMEIATLDAKLDAGVRQWKTNSALTALLKTVYKRYEKERQPETLKEASQYFTRMTGERYQRVWTPLDEDILIIEGQQGQSWTVAELSRGTREQLFLALRLALVSGYARRGIRMPLVLDDVLVNFDQQRTQAAAEVLVDFAQAGHQLLVFTCHEHVMEVFRQANARVQMLPSHQHAGSGTTQVTPAAPAADDTSDERPRSSSTRKRRSRRRRGRAAPAFFIGFTGDEAAEQAGSDDQCRAGLAAVGSTDATGYTGRPQGSAPSSWASVDDWQFGTIGVSPTELEQHDCVEQLFPDHPFTDEQVEPPHGGAETERFQPTDDELAPIDWYPDPRQQTNEVDDQPLDTTWDPLPASPVHSDEGPPSGHHTGVIHDWSIEMRVDQPESPQPTFPTHSGPEAELHPAAADDTDSAELLGHVTGTGPDAMPPESNPASVRTTLLGTAPILPRTMEPGVANPEPCKLETSSEDDVIDLPISAEAQDLTSADFDQKTKKLSDDRFESLTDDELGREFPAEEIGHTAGDRTTPTSDDTVLEDPPEMGTLDLPLLGAPGTPTADSEPVSRDNDVRPTDLQSIQTESSAEFGLPANISSTPDTNLPIDFGGSTAAPVVPSSSSSDTDNKEEPMSTVDRFVSEALPPETPLEPAVPQDVVPASPQEVVSDEYDHEYVDDDEEDGEYEVATATGDVDDAVEYEYEYIDDEEDEDEDGGEDEDEDEYEYVEVEVDEDGNEIEAVAVEDAEEVDDDEYEYVDDDEEDGEHEVATATGDVEDGVEYEYEYVDDDEEEGETDGELSAEADDDEYEYVDEE